MALLMLTKKSLSQLRLALQRVASQTTKAFSHYQTSLESLLKAKWQRMRPPKTSAIATHIYEVRPRADKQGFDLSSDALRYSPLWYRGSNAISNAIGFAKFYNRSQNAVIRVYNDSWQRDRDARAQWRLQRVKFFAKRAETL